MRNLLSLIFIATTCLTINIACKSEEKDIDKLRSAIPQKEIISDREFVQTIRDLKGNPINRDTILLGFILGETKAEVVNHLKNLKQQGLIEDFNETYFRFKIVSESNIFNCLGIIHCKDKLNGIYCLIGAPDHLLPKLRLDDCEGEQFNPYTSAQCKAQKIMAYEAEYKMRIYNLIDSAFYNVLTAYKEKYSDNYHQTETKTDWSPFIWFNQNWLLKLQENYDSSPNLLEYYGDYYDNKSGDTTKTLDPSFFFPTIATVYYFSYDYYYELEFNDGNKQSKQVVPTI